MNWAMHVRVPKMVAMPITITYIRIGRGETEEDVGVDVGEREGGGNRTVVGGEVGEKERGRKLK